MQPEQWIFLIGNLSEGFEVFGPYDDYDTMRDRHEDDLGWGMLLVPAITDSEAALSRIRDDLVPLEEEEF